MFFQNLSNATERKARSSAPKHTKADDASLTSTNEQQEDNAVEKDQSQDNVGAKLSSADVNSTIIYSESSASIPRDVVLGFLNDCCEQLLNEKNLYNVLDVHRISKEPLYQLMMDFQRDIMEYNHHIERNFGCKYLSMIPKYFPDDKEVQNAAKRFMFACMRSYVSALKLNGESIRTLKSEGGMSKEQMLEFFEGCNALMVMPETKVTLKQIFMETRSPPNERIIEMQRSILNQIGIDADYGVSCLNTWQQDFPDDQVIAQKMQQFAVCAQIACKEAMMSDEEKKLFYADIPPFMQHVPHMFVIHQQRLAMMRRQQEMEGGAAGGNNLPMHQHNHSHNHSQSNSIPPPPPAGSNPVEINQLMQLLMSNPESRQKVQALGEKLKSSNARVLDDVNSWTSERREIFFDTMSSSQLIHDLNAVDVDPMVRLDKFINMTDTEIDELMRLRIALTQDMQQGGLGAQRFSTGSSSTSSTGSSSNNSSGVGGFLWGMLSSMTGSSNSSGSGGNISSQPLPPPPPHSHSHGHSHGHNSECPYHGKTSPQADISKGKVDSMDR